MDNVKIAAYGGDSDVISAIDVIHKSNLLRKSLDCSANEIIMCKTMSDICRWQYKNSDYVALLSYEDTIFILKFILQQMEGIKVQHGKD